MPTRRKSQLSRTTRTVKLKRLRSAHEPETEDARQRRLEGLRLRQALVIAAETAGERRERLAAQRLRMAALRAARKSKMPGCALRYCRNTSKNTDKSSGVTFHRFPRALHGPRDRWVHFVRTDRSEPEWSPTEHSYLCSDHFLEHDFIYTQTGRKFTKLSAVPSIPSQYGNSEAGKEVTNEGVKVEVGDKDVWGGNVALGGTKVPTFGGWKAPPDYGSILESATIVPEPGLECSVFGCRVSLREHPDKGFFPFPKEPERRKTWLDLINRRDLAAKLTVSSEHRVCSDHFATSDFQGQGLGETAVPRYQLPLRRVSFVYDDSSYAGPSWYDRPIKKEPVRTMVVEIQCDPATESTSQPQIKQEPTSPTPEVMDVTESNTLETVTVSNMKTVLSTRLTNRQLFLQNATISPVETVDLPGILAESTAPAKNTVNLQTTKLLIDQMNAPFRKAHEAEIREVKKYIRVWEIKMARHARTQTGRKEFQQNCDVYLDRKFSSLVKFHADATVNKPSGNRYSSEFKSLVLNLFFSSPRAYNFVQELFHLPSRATTIRSQLPIRTGINTLFIEYFKAKVDKMSSKEKMCSVCFDYMELNKNLRYCVNNDFLYGLHDIDRVVGTEPASFATLIMVKGLYSEWHQPISFAYVAEKRCYTELKAWLYKIIALLFDIGLNVKALVMNLGCEFLEFPEVSIAESFFEVGGRKVYQIFDVPLLFKNARDTLMEYDFHIGSKVVKWSYVIKVYNADKKQELRLMPKLTDAHLRPKGAENDIKLAIQVFSRTVAAAMNCHVTAKLINAKAKDTVEFILIMNNLFDILNSHKISDENEFKSAYTGAEEQKTFLTNTFEYLKELEVKDKRGNSVDVGVNFVTGLLVTIKSVVSLIEDLEKENFKYTMTKHFSIDCMKTYFDKVRDLGGNCCTKPTPIMFARSFRRLFLVYLVRNSKGVSEMDLKTTLTKISDYVKVDSKNKKDETEPPRNRFLKIRCGDSLKLWPKPGAVFTGGYLLFKCLKKHHQCKTLVEILCAHYKDEVSDAESLLAKFKEYNPNNLTRTDLLEPPEFMVNLVRQMDKIFEEYVQMVDKDMYNFGWNIFLKMQGVLENPCSCFPLMYLKQLFIRMRIAQMTRQYNSSIKPPKNAWRRKGK